LPDSFLYSDDLAGHPGPWVLIDADLGIEDSETERRVFCSIAAVLVRPSDVGGLVDGFAAGVRLALGRLPEPPTDYYTYAGEIPWSREFGRSARADEPEPYRVVLEFEGDRLIEVELLSHTFAWEDYHSPLNAAGTVPVPSQAFSASSDLRGVPQSFDQTTPDEMRAALSFRGPDEFHGKTLYLRKDLVRRYAGRRKLVWLMLGGRHTSMSGKNDSTAVRQVIQAGQNTWKDVRIGSDIHNGL